MPFLQVKEVLDPLEEKLSFLMSEVKFIEKVQKMITSTQVHIKAEVPISVCPSASVCLRLLIINTVAPLQAASSNHHQTVICKSLEDLRKMMDDTQVVRWPGGSAVTVEAGSFPVCQNDNPSA